MPPRCSSPVASAHSGDVVQTSVSRKEHVAEVEELDTLFQAVCPMIREYEMQNTKPDEIKVVEYKSPSDLASTIDLSVPDGEGSLDAFLNGCRDTLAYSVRTSHPRFMNQLYAGSNPTGQVTELLTSVLNSTVHTYAAGPVFSVVERSLIARVAEMIGHPNPSICDGVFAPGGSHANLTAVMTARSVAFPHVANEGWKPEDKPVLFASAHSHYSIRQAASIMGMGAANIVQVPVDSEGRMRGPALDAALDAAVRAGRRPLAVVAVAGTTVLGAYDPVDELVPVCRRHGVWLHVDGAWGGGVLFSDELRDQLLRGVTEADSFCFNPHKLLGMPLQCSMLMMMRDPDALTGATGFAAHSSTQGSKPTATNGEGVEESKGVRPGKPRRGLSSGCLLNGDGAAGSFVVDGGGVSPVDAGAPVSETAEPAWSLEEQEANASQGQAAKSAEAEYLFHEEEEAGEEADLDLGRRSLQCGRKPDALKLWLAWKRHGTAGFARRVDRARALALRLADKVAVDPRFALVTGRPAGFCVCFYYIPPSLRAAASLQSGGAAVSDRGDGGQMTWEAQQRAAGKGPGTGGPVSRAVLARLGPVTARIYARLRRAGTAMINFSPLPDMGLPNFFRAVIMQPQLLAADLDFILNEIDRLGQDL
eukprot:CAMPEP_0113687838 /NCGR_PEP_ID=MMETSP0038_2-20120614/16175_1 /TAXON_ID=2898 /ORGANISM="Cryptomonas paramecium" /LENGTH=646 /DNA_ID=CAMNT_0000608531 /DNA_START=1 /DNA_END=1941 /DNA_ORIENTATION=- /assembly_acc=CAM_ASM_000170